MPYADTANIWISGDDNLIGYSAPKQCNFQYRYSTREGPSSVTQITMVPNPCRSPGLGDQMIFDFALFGNKPDHETCDEEPNEGIIVIDR